MSGCGNVLDVFEEQWGSHCVLSRLMQKDSGSRQDDNGGSENLQTNVQTTFFFLNSSERVTDLMERFKQGSNDIYLFFNG